MVSIPVQCKLQSRSREVVRIAKGKSLEGNPCGVELRPIGGGHCRAGASVWTQEGPHVGQSASWTQLLLPEEAATAGVKEPWE